MLNQKKFYFHIHVNNNFLVKQKLKTKKDKKDCFEIHDKTIGDFTLMTSRFKLIFSETNTNLAFTLLNLKKFLFFPLVRRKLFKFLFNASLEKIQFVNHCSKTWGVSTSNLYSSHVDSLLFKFS